jgi:transcriptional regulator with PAS, ATPase and Fis domain
VILAKGEIDVRLLNLEADDPREPAPSGEGVLQASEREAIRKVLAETGGNRKQAARILGISVRTLQYRIKEYGL